MRPYHVAIPLLPNDDDDEVADEYCLTVGSGVLLAPFETRLANQSAFHQLIFRPALDDAREALKRDAADVEVTWVRSMLRNLSEKYFESSVRFKLPGDDGVWMDPLDASTIELNNYYTDECWPFIGVWFRVNGARHLQRHHVDRKREPLLWANLQAFQDAHAPLMAQFEEHGPRHRFDYDQWNWMGRIRKLTATTTTTSATLTGMRWQRMAVTPTPRSQLALPSSLEGEGLFCIMVKHWLRPGHPDPFGALDSYIRHYGNQHIHITHSMVHWWNPMETLDYDLRHYSLLTALILWVNCLEWLRTTTTTTTEQQFHLTRLLGAYVAPAFHVMAFEARAPHNANLSARFNEEDRDNVKWLDKHWPTPESGFWAGDLPELSCMWRWFDYGPLSKSIPFAKVLMKTMPFVGKRRDLVKQIIQLIETNDAFWLVFRRMVWCTLGGFYPWATTGGGVPFRALLRLHYLCGDDPQPMVSALRVDQINSCPIIFVVFREYYMYAMEHTEFRTGADPIGATTPLDRDHVIAMGRVARERANALHLAPDSDPLQHVRNALVQFDTASRLPAQRNAPASYVATMVGHIEGKEMADSLIYRGRALTLQWIDVIQRCAADNPDALLQVGELGRFFDAAECTPRQLWERDRPEYDARVQRLIAFLWDTFQNARQLPSAEQSENMLDYAMKASPEERLHFEVLLLPQMGGVLPRTIAILYKTRQIYLGKPGQVKALLGDLRTRDFYVVARYLKIISRLEQIEFIPRIHYDDDDGPSPPKHVIMTVCCKRMATYAEPHSYGHENVTYDMVRRNLVCGAKSKPPKQERSFLEMHEPKHARKLRKAELSIPCYNPVLSVHLPRTHALVHRGVRYECCESCGFLHRYYPLGWVGGRYRCPTCVREAHIEQWECTACQQPIAKFKAVHWRVRASLTHPLGFVLEPRCKTHYK